MIYTSSATLFFKRTAGISAKKLQSVPRPGGSELPAVARARWTAGDGLTTRTAERAYRTREPTAGRAYRTAPLPDGCTMCVGRTDGRTGAGRAEGRVGEKADGRAENVEDVGEVRRTRCYQQQQLRWPGRSTEEVT